jgi:hypothetical protein
MGTWQGHSVALTLSPASKGPPPPSAAPFGHLTGFVTNDPSTSCLGSEASLNVWPLNSLPNQYLVVTQTPGDCVNAEFTFTYP